MSLLSFLLKAFLPSWRFFDDVASDFEIEYQVREGSDLSSWLQLQIPSQGNTPWLKNLTQLFHNPETNYQLYIRGQFARGVEELTSPNSVAAEMSLETQKLLTNFVRKCAGRPSRFRILVDTEELFISGWTE